MNVPILPTISTSCIVISAILVAIGWALIWKRQVHKHKNIMLWEIGRASCRERV